MAIAAYYQAEYELPPEDFLSREEEEAADETRQRILAQTVQNALTRLTENGYVTRLEQAIFWAVELSGRPDREMAVEVANSIGLKLKDVWKVVRKVYSFLVAYLERRPWVKAFMATP